MNGPFINPVAGQARSHSVALLALTSAAAVALAVVTVLSVIREKADLPQEAARLLTEPKGDTAHGRRLAAEVLKSAPYSPQLLSALAIADDREGNGARAAKLLDAAAKLSWRDALTNQSLIKRDLTAGNLDEGTRRIDALLRNTPELADAVYPVLVSMAANPHGADAIAARLSQRPAWRSGFLAKLVTTADPDVSFGILSRLQMTPSPPLEIEASGYVQHLMELKRYDQALLGMFLFLPAEHMKAFKNLFNGDFDAVTGIMPFDWAISPASGASLTMEAPPARPNDRALHIFYSGSDANPLISQSLVLAAGAYRITGQSFSGTPDTSKRLLWTLQCPDGSKILNFASISTEQWTTFRSTFEVPATCGAQELKLQATTSDTSAPVEIWYDKLAIEQVGGT